MERRRIIYLFSLVALILVFSSCHPRHVSDIKQNMTKKKWPPCGGGQILLVLGLLMGKLLKPGNITFQTPILSVGSLFLKTE